VVATIPLEGNDGKPVGVVVSRDGARVYVANATTGRVCVVDAASHTVVGTVSVGRRPWGIALSRDGTQLYTANGVSDDVTIVDTRTLRTVGTVPVGKRPWGVTVVHAP
jgi:YVTN family beta-propeller protein